jgi:hypothetical protein
VVVIVAIIVEQVIALIRTIMAAVVVAVNLTGIRGTYFMVSVVVIKVMEYQTVTAIAVVAATQAIITILAFRWFNLLDQPKRSQLQVQPKPQRHYEYAVLYDW